MKHLIISSFQKLKWSVNRKITACFISLLFLILVSSIVVFFSILNLEASNNAQRQKSLTLLEARNFSRQLQNQFSAYSDAIYLTQQKVINASYSLQTQDSLTRIRLAEPTKMADPNSNLAKLSSGYAELNKIFGQLNKLLLDQDVTGADRLWATNLTLRNFVLNTSAAYQKELTDENNLFGQESENSSTFTKSTAVFTGALGVVVAAFLAWLVSEAIGRPLAITRRYLEAMSAGDLSGTLTLINQDELGDLAHALNISVGTLRGILESFNIGSQIEDAVTDLKLISTKQADYAVEQVSYITQASSAMHELSSTAEAINENASGVAEAAKTTLKQVQYVSNASTEVSQVVQELKLVVEEASNGIVQANQDFTYLIQRLNEVDKQSQSTNVIIEIITDIAHQTHLLSLNAAIEAAGAGQFGERFSVIAREVKELAARSSKSADEVKSLIAGTRQSIEEARSQAEIRQQNIGNVVSLGSQVEEVVEKVLLRVETNQKAVTAILEAAELSNYQATQIKSAAFEQQAASQQILATINSITEAVNIGAEGSNKVAYTSVQLSHISRSLTERLAELKLPVTVGV